MSMFGKKISIDQGSKYDTSKVSSEGISKEERAELEKKNKKLIDVFKAFDQDGNGDLNNLELAAAMDAFSKMDTDKKDGKLSNKELQQGANILNQFFKDKNVNIEAKGLKTFLKEISKLTENDPKLDTQQVINDYQTQQTENLKQQQANQTPPPPQTPSQEPKQEEPPKEPKKLNSYTVQEGESFTELIKKDLKSQGIENPTKEQIQTAKEKFKENNPNAVKTAKNGTEYLMVGDKVNLEGSLEDKDNANEQIKKYAEKYPPKINEPAKEETPPPTTPPAEETPTPPAAKEPVKETPAEQEIPKTKTEAAKALGLRETFASQSKGVYYDEKTQTHYQWNKETQKFEAMDKNFRMIGKDGKKFDKNGKWVNDNDFELKKDGTDVYTYKGGSTSTTTYDANGNKTKEVYKNTKGKVTSSWAYTYDANGNMIKRVSKDDNEKVDGSTEYTYDTNGNKTKTVYKDADGKVTSSEEYTYDTKGNMTKEVFKDANGKEISEEEWIKLL